VPTSAAEFHQEATAEYDTAFDWYLERSPDAALKFDAEVDRALAQIIHASATLGRWSILYSQVPAQTVSVYSDLPGTSFGKNSDRGGCPHQPEARLLEAAALTRGLVEICARERSAEILSVLCEGSLAQGRKIDYMIQCVWEANLRADEGV
jgi:hypothetical protein